MKLILCAGTRHLEGYKHHDVKAYPGTDYVCDLRDITKHVAEGSCEEVHFTHALEHFPTAETEEILYLLKSLLAPGGKLYLEVPNFIWHAKILLEGRETDAVYYCFGGQLDEWDFHKTGFTPAILQDKLENCGFVNIKIYDSSSITATCEKKNA